ncbi:helix-turn-helix transcriptional regulator [Mycolicibacterium litorale]|uniref:helix-turn-helix transcriptional regulator n=1 Tax=Mycolicibacterium litorale TaxID=758802 RepID=UPI00399F1FB3
MPTPRRLIGRQREQQELARLLTGAREGRSGVVVLRGDAGMGKTSLLEYLEARATDFRTLRIVGSESEMELAYAGLHQLCSGLLGRLDQLPPPQQRALRVALGLADGDPPDRLMVGLAVLTLLAEVSSERPTLCLVDDAQWVDAASLQALAFVARRVIADPIVIVFAACKRREDRLLSDLPELQIRGLDDHDARMLLDRSLPGQLDEQVRENIIAEARGNPLALLELHRVLSPAELAGGFGLAEADQLTNRLERGFGQQVTELSPQTKTLLLLAASDPTGDPRWLRAAAEVLGIPESAAETAEAAQLISIGTRVRFRHPLIRSAVYRSASPSERRRVHRALADVIDGPASDEHRAWHLGHAATGPDEQVAENLERSAGRARSRSGIAAGAAFLEFAADLTPDPHRRAQRALAAARAKLDAGAPESAAQLLIRARHPTDDERLSTGIERMRARCALATGHVSEAISRLAESAHRVREIDPVLARDIYLEALSAAVLAGRSTSPGTSAVAVGLAARADAPTVHPPRAVDLMLDALVARVIDGYVIAAPLLKRAVEAFLGLDAAEVAEPWFYAVITRVTVDLLDFEALHAIAERQLAALRAAGALGSLPRALDLLAVADIFRGRFPEAAAALSEAEAIATAIGDHEEHRADALLAAFRGQEALSHELTAAITDDAAMAPGQGFFVGAAWFSLAVLHNSLGHYTEALSACEQALENADFVIGALTLPEMVEAGTRCGEHAAAGSALARLIARADAGGTRTALGLAARSRALSSDGPAAEADYLAALTHLEQTPAVVYLARTRLVYGEWLRRQGRRVEARAQLRSALDHFTAMGADGFADRTRRELEATGETVRKRGSAVRRVQLTTQEAHITQLARRGHSNSEIAAQLFISPRTVEWHMGKIFTKLGVTSRKELRGMALPVE